MSYSDEVQRALLAGSAMANLVRSVLFAAAGTLAADLARTRGGGDVPATFELASMVGVERDAKEGIVWLIRTDSVEARLFYLEVLTCVNRSHTLRARFDGTRDLYIMARGDLCAPGMAAAMIADVRALEGASADDDEADEEPEDEAEDDNAAD